MKSVTLWALAATLALAAGGTSAGAALQETAAELRATGLIGERWDGYLGAVGFPPARLRAQMDGINIRRRAHYTELAGRRGVRVEEVAIAAGCELLALRVEPGHYYLLPDGIWRQRRGGEAVPRPDWCL
ncbi:MAG: YdbL family protein [Pseudomonadota bacterium]|nr:YdbL family protein [Pseudomonadota bacterium]